MSGKSANSRGTKVPYYEHACFTKRRSAEEKATLCQPCRIRAKLIEPLVWEEVKRFLCIEDVTKQVLSIAKALKPDDKAPIEEERLRKKMQVIEGQTEVLAERIARLPKNVDERVFLNQMAKLQKEKSAIEIKLVEFSNRPQQEAAIEYDSFVKFTEHLRELISQADTSLEVQAAIIRKLVHRIEVSPAGFDIDFYVGKTHITRELGPNPGSPSLSLVEGSIIDSSREIDLSLTLEHHCESRPLAKFLKIRDSKRLTTAGAFLDSKFLCPLKDLSLTVENWESTNYNLFNHFRFVG